MFGTDVVARRLNQQADYVISIALFAAGLVILGVAISPASKWTKALALAYVILP